MELRVPALSVVVLVGPSGSGKSTFARKHFLPTEIVSSDACRALVADDENDQSATPQAFELVHAIVEKRLALGRLVVVDATNVEPLARKALVALAKKHHALAVAVVFHLPERLCAERANRAERPMGAHVVRHQMRELRRGLGVIGREGFSQHWILERPEQLDEATVVRVPLWNDRRSDRGPFDVVGDVHGCLDELRELLERLGYRVEGTEAEPSVTPPPGRKLVFLGDLVDRGPKIAGVLRLAMHMVRTGAALCVPGNHEVKLQRWLLGKQVKVGHGLAASVAELEREPPAFREEVLRFVDGLVSHLVLDGGELVVAHAGLRAELQGRASGAVREFCLYGETTGEIDAYGLPVRADWALGYRGRAAVAYGHTPVPSAEWVNRTICLDTGCVFGGALTALRWPERELVSVKARRTYFEPVRPIGGGHAPRPEVDLLELADVAGKRFVHTRYQAVRLREENAAPALEVMSRFAVAPGWLVHLPPTMSPCETAPEGPLEQPDACFAYFRGEGVREVVCEEKHMGSRAIVVLARTPEAAARRFHERGGRAGVAYTRTGRPFFGGHMEGYERALIDRLRAAAEAAGLWDELATDWMVLDAEILPWSAKAQALLRRQYAPVGAAAEAALARAVELAPSGSELAAHLGARLAAARAYRAAYRRYSWEVGSLDDVAIAPFHLLASEGAVHVERDHAWHLEVLARLAAAEPRLVRATRSEVVELDDPASVARATRWWQELTASGGEGMVVKPRAFLARGTHGLVQPAVKCRGAEYLRIIYGPEYDLPENLPRLRARRLGGKRALALRELALGLEALHRFVEGEPLHRVHECVFGVLALESEPVDPRL